jgi:DNA-binding transcriptional MerR regulator
MSVTRHADITEPRYDLKELSSRTAVTPRTVHFYIQQGLLRQAGAPGAGARYSEDHLNRLRLIRRLQRQHLPLAEIRRRLAGLDAGAVEGLLKASDLEPQPAKGSALGYVQALLAPTAPTPAQPAARSAARPPTALREALFAALASPPPPVAQQPAAPREAPAPERSQWDRITLAPDVELHVRRPLSRDENRRVEHVLKAARAILEEEYL